MHSYPQLVGVERVGRAVGAESRCWREAATASLLRWSLGEVDSEHGDHRCGGRIAGVAGAGHGRLTDTAMPTCRPRVNLPGPIGEEVAGRSRSGRGNGVTKGSRDQAPERCRKAGHDDERPLGGRKRCGSKEYTSTARTQIVTFVERGRGVLDALIRCQQGGGAVDYRGIEKGDGDDGATSAACAGERE